MIDEQEKIFNEIKKLCEHIQKLTTFIQCDFNRSLDLEFVTIDKLQYDLKRIDFEYIFAIQKLNELRRRSKKIIEKCIQERERIR